MKEFKIGEVYTFDYESTSKRKSTSDVETVKVALTEDAKNEVIEYINDNVEDSIERFQSMCDFADMINNTKDKVLKDSMKDEFRKNFGSSKEELPAETKARYLFFRNYKPEGITLTEDGYITAVFAGWNCTITGKVTYKWTVLSPCRIDVNKLNSIEGVEQYIDFLDE